jgi:6-phosphogluconolactonase
MANKRFWFVVCILALMASTVGCGAGSSNSMVTPPPPKAEFFYAITETGPINNLSVQLSTFKVNPSSGALSATSTIPLNHVVAGIAVDPGSRFLYTSGETSIDIFSIDSTTGAPTQAGTFPLFACSSCPPVFVPAGALAFDPTAKFLFYGSAIPEGGIVQGVGALSVGSGTGGLGFVPGSPFQISQAPFSVLVHPSGQFVYTEDAALGLNGLLFQSISGFSVDSSTGALTAVPGSPFAPPAGSDVGGFSIDPSGKFLYAGTGSAANGILGWNIDGTTGELKGLPSSPFGAGIATLSTVLDPAGKFLYASAADGIRGFTVDSNAGVLSPISGSPFFTGSDLVDLVVDPSGQFLFALDIHSSAITGFRVDATTGALTALGNPTPLGSKFGLFAIVQAP